MRLGRPYVLHTNRALQRQIVDIQCIYMCAIHVPTLTFVHVYQEVL